ncbi:MAG: GNAT family N-acetyltransferase [Cyanobacteria bacterium P01_A01_bin.83]
MQIYLTDPTPARKQEFLDMIQEFIDANETHFIYEEVLMNEGFESYLAWLQRGREGQIEGFCPWSAFWAIDRQTNRLLGVCSVRHKLSSWMTEYGGHIGYRVRPSERRKGYGTSILDLAIQQAKQFTPDQILVVCESDNLGSIGVIKNNGGVFNRQVSNKGTILNRYWLHNYIISLINYCIRPCAKLL